METLKGSIHLENVEDSDPITVVPAFQMNGWQPERGKDGGL